MFGIFSSSFDVGIIVLSTILVAFLSSNDARFTWTSKLFLAIDYSPESTSLDGGGV